MKLSLRQLLENVMLTIIAAICIMLSAMRYWNEDSETYYNRARILLANQIQELEQGTAVDTTYPYYLVGTDCRVWESTIENYPVGSTVNMQEVMQIDHSFIVENKGIIRVTFPVVKDGNVTDFAAFYVPVGQVQEQSMLEHSLYIFTPALIGIVLILLFCFYRSIYLKRRILKPITEIAASAQAIVNGNYEQAVINTKSNKVLATETDRLIVAFELMRDELQDKEIKEERLKRSQKELVSCISHDLKTPISTIKAYSEGLRDGVAVDEEKRQKFVGTIISKTETVTKLLNDLLEHSNAEMNELSICKKEQYIGEYFEKIIKELEIYVNQRGCSLETKNEVPNILVEFDENRITQVIYNLIENAIKYMDKEEKKISITMDYQSGNQTICIRVTDNGPGISMMDIPYVFDKFYRAEKSRSTSIQGSGLGLSICKYIVEAHGGTIECKSKTGQGCTFTFFILA